MLTRNDVYWCVFMSILLGRDVYRCVSVLTNIVECGHRGGMCIGAFCVWGWIWGDAYIYAGDVPSRAIFVEISCAPTSPPVGLGGSAIFC